MPLPTEWSAPTKSPTLEPGSEPILYQSDDDKVFLIDVPTSIADAQNLLHADEYAMSNVLLSCPPLAMPFSSTEPKSKAGVEKVKNHSRDLELHQLYSRLAQEGLSRLRSSCDFQALFCLPRVVMLEVHEQGKKRKASSPAMQKMKSNNVNAKSDLDTESDSRKDSASSAEISILLCDLPNRTRLDYLKHVSWEVCPTPRSPTPNVDKQDEFQINNWDCSFHNKADKSVRLSITDPTKPPRCPPFSFKIPPRSAFLLGDCDSPSAFRPAARAFTTTTPTHRFNFILLDPPWPNRSAKRKASYIVPNSSQSVTTLMLNMDLDMQILPGGFIAVWTTNKSACREHVLGPGGLFESWNVGLVEEWIWLKVTSGGEPVTQIDGVWRKPYEVLVIGQAPESSMVVAREAGEVVRRVIVGVPDLHSRKPGLKRVVERVLLKGVEEYTALEVFARYLVAGWFSWGDEVLKYNWDGHWTRHEKAEREPQHQYATTSDAILI